MSPSNDTRRALERIAELGLEGGWPDEGWYVVDEMAEIALEALGWERWRCSSRFTGCTREELGPLRQLLDAGWVKREGAARCPDHALTTDPKQWLEGMRPR